MWFVLLAVVLVLAILVALAATALGLPGLWFMVLCAACLNFFAPETSFIHVTWTGTAILLALAVTGELIEFFASAAGASKLGGSRRSGWLALIGSMLGAIAGLFIGLPIPVAGPLITSILLGGIGAAAGAIVGERWAGQDWNQSARVGLAAAVGRLLGTFGKTVCAAIMAVMLIWMVCA